MINIVPIPAIQNVFSALSPKDFANDGSFSITFKFLDINEIIIIPIKISGAVYINDSHEIFVVTEPIHGTIVWLIKGISVVNIELIVVNKAPVITPDKIIL